MCIIPLTIHNKKEKLLWKSELRHKNETIIKAKIDKHSFDSSSVLYLSYTILPSNKNTWNSVVHKLAYIPYPVTLLHIRNFILILVTYMSCPP